MANFKQYSKINKSLQVRCRVEHRVSEFMGKFKPSINE